MYNIYIYIIILYLYILYIILYIILYYINHIRHQQHIRIPIPHPHIPMAPMAV